MGIMGSFLLNPVSVHAIRAFVYPGPLTGGEVREIGMQQISLDEVLSAFPGRRVFTMDARDLVELR